MSLACNVGYNARLYGYASLKACPYMRGTFCYNEWVYGWKMCDESKASLCEEQCMCAKKG